MNIWNSFVGLFRKKSNGERILLKWIKEIKLITKEEYCELYDTVVKREQETGTRIKILDLPDGTMVFQLQKVDQKTKGGDK